MADSTWCVAMLNEATDARQRRGLMIAATEVIGRNEAGDYMVPSQSKRTRRYRVVKGQEGFQCACPDFEWPAPPATTSSGLFTRFTSRAHSRCSRPWRPAQKLLRLPNKSSIARGLLGEASLFIDNQ